MDILNSNTTPKGSIDKNTPITIQSWKSKTSAFDDSPQRKIEKNLNRAAQGNIGDLATRNNFDQHLTSAYAPIDNTNNTTKPYDFNDVLDIVNPLHHLPIIGNIYRSTTGDELKPMSRLIGGTLFGGPVGAVTSTVNVISEMQTGQDLNDRALNMIGLGNPQKNMDPNFINQQYQETDEHRTVNWGHEGKINSLNTHTPYYDPITELKLTPMPPRTLIDA